MTQQTKAQRLAAAWGSARTARNSINAGYMMAEELRRLDAENKALRSCAIKYLDYLRIPNQEKALEDDMKNPEMLK